MRVSGLALLYSARKDIRDSILCIKVPAQLFIYPSKKSRHSWAPGRFEVLEILKFERSYPFIEGN